MRSIMTPTSTATTTTTTTTITTIRTTTYDSARASKIQTRCHPTTSVKENHSPYSADISQKRSCVVVCVCIDADLAEFPVYERGSTPPTSNETPYANMDELIDDARTNAPIYANPDVVRRGNVVYDNQFARDIPVVYEALV
jgi:hypothetical protein